MVIDLIIPFYNAQATIARTLSSIVTQKLDEDDVINTHIVNDCSTEVTPQELDELCEYFGQMLDIQLINKEKNEGPGLARQTGIEHSNGDYIAFVDADDVLGSPFAIRTLVREMKERDLDICMGMFVEETPKGTIFNHEENWIWLHGKMFKRSYIEENKFRFNDTYENEDVGFLSLIKQFTDKTAYIPQVVYIWLNQNGSMVRTDRESYAYGYGWRGFVENLSWSCEEMRARKLCEPKALRFATECLCRLYWQELDANENRPEEADENENKVKDFYQRAVRPLVIRGGIQEEYVTETYRKIMSEWRAPIVIPTRGFYEYLTDIGFYKDLEKGAD